MPRLTIDVSYELKQRILKYIAKRYDTFYGKINEVVRLAVEEFLDRHGVNENGDE